MSTRPKFEWLPPEFVADQKQIREVSKGDIIISKVGSPCYASYVAEHEVIGLSRTVLGLTKVTGIDPVYLTMFLRSKAGFTQLVRERELTIQYQLTLDRIRRIRVYVGSEQLQAAVRAVAQRSEDENAAAISASILAEAALLSALGLAGWTPPEPLSYTARAADALSAARLDAQYFMPSKLQMIEALQAIPSQPLGARFNSVRAMFDPAKADPDLLVRNFDLPDALNPILDDDKELAACGDIGSLKKTMRNGDVAMSRLRAYLRETAVVRTGTSHLAVGSSAGARWECSTRYLQA